MAARVGDTHDRMGADRAVVRIAPRAAVGHRLRADATLRVIVVADVSHAFLVANRQNPAIAVVGVTCLAACGVDDRLQASRCRIVGVLHGATERVAHLGEPCGCRIGGNEEGRREDDGAAVRLGQRGHAAVDIACDRQRIAVAVALLDQQIQAGDGPNAATADPAAAKAPDAAVPKAQRLDTVRLLHDDGAAQPWIAAVDESVVRLAGKVVACVAGQHEPAECHAHVEQGDVDRQGPALTEEELEAGDAAEGVEGVVRAVHDRRGAAGLQQVHGIDEMLSDRQIDRLAVLGRAFVGGRLRVLVVDEAAEPADAAEPRDADAGIGHDRLSVVADRAQACQSPRGGRVRQWGRVVIPELRLLTRVEPEIVRQRYGQRRRRHAAHRRPEE